MGEFFSLRGINDEESRKNKDNIGLGIIFLIIELNEG